MQVIKLLELRREKGVIEVNGGSMKSSSRLSPRRRPYQCPFSEFLNICTARKKIQETGVIIRIRENLKDVGLTDDAAVGALVEVTGRICLRYATKLLTPASILAGVKGQAYIIVADVKESNGLFQDSKAPARLVLKCQQVHQLRIVKYALQLEHSYKHEREPKRSAPLQPQFVVPVQSS